MSGRHALSDLNSERQLANSPKEKAQKVSFSFSLLPKTTFIGGCAAGRREMKIGGEKGVAGNEEEG